MAKEPKAKTGEKTDKKSWLLTIDGVHPSLNTWTRMHFHLRNKLKQDWELLTIDAANKAKLPHIKQPVKIFLKYFHPKDNVDLDNFTPKFILDGLKRYLEDDNIKYIKELGWSFEKSKHKYTEVLITIF